MKAFAGFVLTLVLVTVVVVGVTGSDAATAAQTTPDPQQTEIVFYAGNRCTVDAVHTVQAEDWEGRPPVNDAARSARFSYLPAGTRIEVYNHPDAQRHLDYAIIEVRAPIADYCLRTFEQNFDTDRLYMTYRRGSGLDGQVSYIRVIYP